MGLKPLVLIFSLISNNCLGFEFQGIPKSKEFVFEAYKQLECNCILLFNEFNSHELDRLFFMISKGLVSNHRRELVLIGKTTFENYKNYFLPGKFKNHGSCFNTLSILLASPKTRNLLEKYSRNHEFVLSTWLIFQQEEDYTFYDNVSLPINSRVGAVRVARGRDAIFSEVFQVAPGHKTKVKPFGRWRESLKLTTADSNWLRRRANLDQFMFRAVSIESWPFSTFNVEHPTSSDKEFDGMYARIWYLLEETLNFTTNLTRSYDHSLGLRDSNGRWTKTMALIVNNDVDVIVTETDYLAQRAQVLDYIYPLTYVRFQIYFRSDKIPLDWLSVLRPFHWYVWLVLAGWIIFAAFSIKLCRILSNRFCNRECRQMSFFNSFLFLLRTLSFQGTTQDLVPIDWPNRIAFLSCYLLAAVVIPSYSAALVSTLTQKVSEKPFDSLEGLLQSNYKLYVMNQSGPFDFFLNNGNNYVRQTIYEKKLLPYSSVENKKEVARKILNIVCKSEEYYSMFSTDQVFNHLYGFSQMKRDFCTLGQLSKPVGKIPQSIAFHKNSPYTKLFDYHVLRMAESGILKKHYSYFFLKELVEKKDNSRPVHLVDVAEIFVFLLLAIVLSWFIAVCENVYYNKIIKK